MNKGKENYQNIPLPDGLSDAVQKGLKKGRRHMEKKWITAIGTLAAACVLGFVVLKVLPDNLRTPQENAPSAQSRLASPQDGQTPEAAAYSAEEDPSGASPASMGTPSEDSSEAAVQEAAPSSIRVSGTVAQIDEEGRILLENKEEGAAYPQVLLNVTDDTLILSGADCSEKTLSDIAEGDILYADISPAMTRSIPPMANAFVVFCETQEDTTVPTYAVITDIQTSEDGQTTIITDQDLVLLPGTDTKILSLEGNSALPLSDLNIGDAILARFSIMTASLPAQASPDSIWVIGQEAAAVEIE